MSKHSGAIARSYGTALFETLVSNVKNNADFEKSVEQLRLINSFCTKRIINYFMLSSLTRNEKFQTLDFFLEKVINNDKLDPQIVSFLKVVLENKRFKDIKAIFSFFFEKSDEHLGISRATIISARSLQEQEIKEFESSLQNALNKKIILKTECDESLKSGFVIKLGHMNIDASFKTRLNSLKELFI